MLNNSKAQGKEINASIKFITTPEILTKKVSLFIFLKLNEYYKMNEKLIVSGLLEIYGKLLTEKQREMAELYYSCDLSLGEIAEIKGVSRQTVNETVKKVKAELENFEQKIGFYQIKSQLIKLSGEVDENTSKRLTEIIEN